MRPLHIRLVLLFIPFAMFAAMLSPANAANEKDDGKLVVYATNTGTKYHAAGCKFLAKSKIETTLQAAKAKGLTACSVCNPPK